jgi:hypothetical protein
MLERLEQPLPASWEEQRRVLSVGVASGLLEVSGAGAG